MKLGKLGQFIKGNQIRLGSKGVGYWKGKKRPDMSLRHSSEGNPMWKGNAIGKKGIHIWLRRKFGTPNNCDHCFKDDCVSYDWALKTGLNYERNRENFLRLCRGCHMKYDYKSGVRKIYHPTVEVKERIRNTLLNRI